MPGLGKGSASGGGVPAPGGVFAPRGVPARGGGIPALSQTPPSCGQIDRCKNITFATLLRAVIIVKSTCASVILSLLL